MSSQPQDRLLEEGEGPGVMKRPCPSQEAPHPLPVPLVVAEGEERASPLRSSQRLHRVGGEDSNLDKPPDHHSSSNREEVRETVSDPATKNTCPF
ncbi:MAG: hypothetical protein MJE68_33355 [Proteobacteria bacterium]|nr:hypothetical protein [Pseudomonadota bacterium]